MRVETMKSQVTLKLINQAVLSSGTASGIWFEESQSAVSSEQLRLCEGDKGQNQRLN